jgi:ribosomal-protein-alanine N-acetyltransferase
VLCIGAKNGGVDSRRLIDGAKAWADVLRLAQSRPMVPTRDVRVSTCLPAAHGPEAQRPQWFRSVHAGACARMPAMTSPPITLRMAELHDAPPIALMSRDLVEHGLPWAYRPDRIRRLIADRDTIVLVAERQGVVGFAAMPFAAEHPHMLLMAVRREAQRRGGGKRMIEWLLRTATTAGITSLHLELRADNHGAFQFYRALGFAPTVRVHGYYQGREAAIRMLRLLREPGAPALDWDALVGRWLRPEP